MLAQNEDLCSQSYKERKGHILTTKKCKSSAVQAEVYYWSGDDMVQMKRISASANYTTLRTTGIIPTTIVVCCIFGKLSYLSDSMLYN